MKMVLVILISLFQGNSSQRVLDIYTNSTHDQNYLKQLSLLNADPSGLKERDVVVRLHQKATGFRIVLTGKDGAEKYSSIKILTPDKLYAIIDAMPMRKKEMLEQANKRSEKKQDR